VLLRERLAAGDTDRQVLDYVVARYGVFVLLDPPFLPATYLLWLAPPLLVLGAAIFLIFRAKRRGQGLEPPALTEQERARAAVLLGDRG
jgi:cytochrome c-type biogenesis protein CcmH